ncbi:MAG TPA: endonuclease domain-containing protein [Thermoanaerobaculia bacterium]|nr:endonuclease domain-containing protein [Thermoanaerobaculia bacterium]
MRTEATPVLRGVARELRKAQTPAEEALWELLRDRRFLGLKFRRQVPLGRFVADFLCQRLHLVLEVDGEIHQADSQAVRDRDREACLRGLGYSVLRFSNDQVLQAPQEVLRSLEAWVR